MVRKSFGKVFFSTFASLALAGAGIVLSPLTSSATVLPAGQTFSYTGSDQTYVVPSGCLLYTSPSPRD